MVDVYRRKVSDLAVALNVEETRAEAVDILRSVVEEVRLTPGSDGTLGVVLVGALAGILALTNERPRGEAAGAQLAMVAGARSHLYRTRALFA